MSSIIEKGLVSSGSLLGVGEHDLARSDESASDLATEIAAQQERLHTLRRSVLQQLGEQRRGLPRWPSGPKFVPTLVDEGEWWAKMLGRKQAA